MHVPLSFFSFVLYFVLSFFCFFVSFCQPTNNNVFFLIGVYRKSAKKSLCASNSALIQRLLDVLKKRTQSNSTLLSAPLSSLCVLPSSLPSSSSSSSSSLPPQLPSVFDTAARILDEKHDVILQASFEYKRMDVTKWHELKVNYIQYLFLFFFLLFLWFCGFRLLLFRYSFLFPQILYSIPFRFYVLYFFCFCCFFFLLLLWFRRRLEKHKKDQQAKEAKQAILKKQEEEKLKNAAEEKTKQNMERKLMMEEDDTKIKQKTLEDANVKIGEGKEKEHKEVVVSLDNKTDIVPPIPPKKLSSGPLLTLPSSVSFLQTYLGDVLLLAAASATTAATTATTTTPQDSQLPLSSHVSSRPASASASSSSAASASSSSSTASASSSSSTLTLPHVSVSMKPAIASLPSRQSPLSSPMSTSSISLPKHSPSSSVPVHQTSVKKSVPRVIVEVWPCPYFWNGDCRDGANCLLSHGNEETLGSLRASGILDEVTAAAAVFAAGPAPGRSRNDSQNRWNCEVCTYLNAGSASNACVMCAAPAPAPVPVPSPQPQPQPQTSVALPTSTTSPSAAQAAPSINTEDQDDDEEDEDDEEEEEEDEEDISDSVFPSRTMLSSK